MSCVFQRKTLRTANTAFTKHSLLAVATVVSLSALPGNAPQPVDTQTLQSNTPTQGASYSHCVTANTAQYLACVALENEYQSQKGR